MREAESERQQGDSGGRARRRGRVRETEQRGESDKERASKPERVGQRPARRPGPPRPELLPQRRVLRLLRERGREREGGTEGWREREVGEREIEWERGSGKRREERERMCVCVCVRERERERENE